MLGLKLRGGAMGRERQQQWRWSHQLTEVISITSDCAKLASDIADANLPIFPDEKTLPCRDTLRFRIDILVEADATQQLSSQNRRLQAGERSGAWRDWSKRGKEAWAGPPSVIGMSRRRATAAHSSNNTNEDEDEDEEAPQQETKDGATRKIGLAVVSFIVFVLVARLGSSSSSSARPPISVGGGSHPSPKEPSP